MIKCMVYEDSSQTSVFLKWLTGKRTLVIVSNIYSLTQHVKQLSLVHTLDKIASTSDFKPRQQKMFLFTAN